MPVETVPSRPCGLPKTTISCPTTTLSESDRDTAGVESNEVWTVTRSCFRAKFRMRTAVPVRPRQRTLILVAPPTTWALVTRTPSRVMKNPLPSASG
jgi:hypothetical protein